MNIHLISIGGAVMHNLAMELQRNGHHVTGSDDEIFEPSKSRLALVGLLPKSMGWDVENIHADLDVVILGMHARADNPELIKAQQLNLSIQSFPEFIYNHSLNKKRVVIAGSHGKTTTTAMAMHVLKERGLDFDYLVGSKLEGFDLMVRLSDAPIIVIEGDEYLSSAIDRRPKFLWYKSHIAVITGIAWDHINVFPTYDNYTEQFGLLMDSMPNGASLIYYKPDADLSQIAMGVKHLKQTPYQAPESTVLDGTMSVHVGNQTFPMSIFGDHNLANMQAAVHVCAALGMEEADAWKALQSFKGTARRLEKMFDNHNKVAFRDFAHSPSKVAATVDAVRKAYPNYTLIAALELHTFSSLNKDFLPLYKDTMKQADKAIVHFNPHVFEMKKMPILNAEEVAGAFGDVEVITEVSELQRKVCNASGEKIVYLLMSSGHWGGLDWTEILEN